MDGFQKEGGNFFNLLQKGVTRKGGGSLRKGGVPTLEETMTFRIALRFLLASGEGQASLSYYFKIGKATACGIVEEVYEAIWTALQDYV